MPFVGNILPMIQKTTAKHSVAVLISDGLGLFEFGIATEIFGLARPEFDFPWYDFSVVCTSAKQVTATGGVQVSASKSLDHLKHVDTIIIPSWNTNSPTPPERLIDAINTAANNNTRLLSICSGVFLLAAAGLLEGKKVTTHWKHINKLTRLFPNIEVTEDALYIDHGNIICSAGSSAGIDACMHLVRRDFGTAIANDVARRLVSHPHRTGGQKQFIPKPVQERKNNTISMAMQWATERLSEQIGVAEMAEYVHMSERTFFRHFRATVESTPAQWLQHTRIANAQALLENTNDSMTSIAEQSGYHSMETFRIAFKRVTGLSASAYKSNFNAP